jgi:hypothetical protein
MDSIENYYLVESMDAVYLLTRDLKYAAVKQKIFSLSSHSWCVLSLHRFSPQNSQFPITFCSSSLVFWHLFICHVFSPFVSAQLSFLTGVFQDPLRGQQYSNPINQRWRSLSPRIQRWQLHPASPQSRAMPHPIQTLRGSGRTDRGACPDCRRDDCRA